MRTLGVLLVMLVLSGCGGQHAASTSNETPAEETADIASADPNVRYFHEQLIADGEDVQSALGGHLLTLGMHARDLLQDDPKHAYDTVLEKVRAVPDPALRRDMMRAFFNVADAP